MAGQAYRTADSRGGRPPSNQHPQGKAQENRQRTVLERVVLAIVIVGFLLLIVVLVYGSAAGATAMAFSDWLKVLIVPLVLAVIAYFFNRSLKMHELNIAGQRAQDEALIAEQRAQDGALQSYLEYSDDADGKATAPQGPGRRRKCVCESGYIISAEEVIPGTQKKPSSVPV